MKSTQILTEAARKTVVEKFAFAGVISGLLHLSILGSLVICCPSVIDLGTQLVAGFGALTFVLVARTFLWRGREIFSQSPDGIVFWQSLFNFTALTLAFTWGLLAAIVLMRFHISAESMIFTTIVLGVAAISLPSYGSQLVLLRCFLFAILAPEIMVTFFHYETPGMMGIGWAISLFLGFSLALARGFSNTTVEALLHKDIMRDQRCELQALVSAVPGYMAWFNPQGEYLGVNTAMTAILRRHRTELIGTPVGVRDGIPFLRLHIQNFIESKRTEAFINVQEVFGEKKRDLLLNISRIEAENQQQFIVVIAVDLSGSKETAA